MKKSNKILPTKVNWKHKKTFPLKRDNYKNYSVAKWSWYDVFLEIDESIKDNPKCKKNIADKYNIKYNTLRDKYKKWVDDGKLIMNNNDNRGGHNKLITEDNERKLYEYLKELYINNNLFLDDELIKISATKTWKYANPQVNDNYEISAAWVYYFKKRWNLSSLTARPNKKSTNTNDGYTYYYLNLCANYYLDLNSNLIFNMDETKWLIVNNNPKVIGITGSENRKITYNVNEKIGFTAVFTINAAGLFMKPIIIIKGKSNRCLIKTKYIDNDKIILKYSDNGWINVEIMKFLLNEINKITQNKESILILDQYSVHTNELVISEAKKLNIKLIYVPVGKTDKHQPLDVNINGPLKSIGKHIDKEKYLMDPFIVPTIDGSIDSLIESINKIQTNTIINSFKIAFNLQ